MKAFYRLAASILAFSLSGAAIGQVYESKDSSGNPVFTDTPSAGSEVLDLPATNTADSPPDIPATPTRSQQDTALTAEKHYDEGSVTVIGDTHNERIEEAVEDSRRHDVLEPEKRHDEGGVQHIGERVQPERVPHSPPKAHSHGGVHKR